MYAKINNGLVEKYPYTIGELRKDNPQISFPFYIKTETLEEFGVVPVEVTSSPKIDATQNVVEGTPTLKDGKWVQTWNISLKPQEEIDAIRLEKEDEIRSARTQKLMSCDWTQAKDIPDSISQTWAPYRQALRDITEQPGFPFNVTWPVPPQE